MLHHVELHELSLCIFPVLNKLRPFLRYRREVQVHQKVEKEKDELDCGESYVEALSIEDLLERFTNFGVLNPTVQLLIN